MQFWKAICTPGGILAEETENGDKFLTLKDNVMWDDVSPLYVRSSYCKLKNLFLDANVRSGLLLGTPGIGKSLFLRWLLSELVSKKTGDLCIRVIIRMSKREWVDYWCDTADGGSVVHYDASKSLPDYFLSDSMDISKINLSQILTLLVSSDDDEHYKEWQKVLRKHRTISATGETIHHGLIKYMPLFSLEESICIDPDSLEYCALKYDIVGGSARNFVSSSGKKDAELKVLVTASFEEFFVKPKSRPKGPLEQWNMLCNWAVDSVVHALVGVTDAKHAKLVFNSLFRHIAVDENCDRMGVVWASKFLEYIAGAIVNNSENNILNELRKILQGSGEGYMYEFYDGHKFLKKMTVDRTPYPLYDLKEGKTISVTFNVTRYILIRSVDDIKSLENGDCGIATTNNFPLADFVMKGVIFPGNETINIVGNFTIAEKHTGSLKTLPTICTNLGGVCYSLIVTPQENMCKFKYNKKLKLAQFVTSNERVSTEKALITLYKKPSGKSALAKRKQGDR